MSGVFISLYGLGVGYDADAGWSAAGGLRRLQCRYPADQRARGKQFGHRGLSYAGIPLQWALLMLIPLFTGFGSILAVYVLAGILRAVVIVANAVGLVQDVDEERVRRGVASGIYNAAGDLGNILGPTIGGLIAQPPVSAACLSWLPRLDYFVSVLVWALKSAQQRPPLPHPSLKFGTRN